MSIFVSIMATSLAMYQPRQYSTCLNMDITCTNRRIKWLGWYMMTSWYRNAFRVTGTWSGEPTGYRWIPLTTGPLKFPLFEQFADDLRRHDAHVTSNVMERQSVTLTTTNIDILTVILRNTRQAIITTHPGIISGNGLSQWETTLQRNVVFHWLGPYPEWFLTSDCNTSYLNHYHDYVHLCMYKHIHITYSDGWDQILNIILW